MSRSTRDKRLENEYRLIREFLDRKVHIVLEVIEGDPPDYYQISFHTCGIVRLESGDPVYERNHRVEFILPAEYPRNGPNIRYLTPIFHPNFYEDGDVCVSTWIPGRTLITLIQQIDDMIAYRNFDVHKIDNAPNSEAARWASKHPELIPINTERCE